MEFHDLRVLLAIASERSFSRAAKKLGRTQPAVSQALRRLEEQLGEPLVDRSARDGTLTEAGVTFRDFAQRLVDLAGEAERAVGARGLVALAVFTASDFGGIERISFHAPLVEAQLRLLVSAVAAMK